MPFHIDHYPEIDFYPSLSKILDGFVLATKDGMTDAFVDHTGMAEDDLHCTASLKNGQKRKYGFTIYSLKHHRYRHDRNMRLPRALIRAIWTFDFERKELKVDGKKRYQYQHSPAGIYRKAYENTKGHAEVLDEAIRNAEKAHADTQGNDVESYSWRTDSLRDSL